METATARAPQPGNEKGRPVAGRPFGSLINYGNPTDNPARLRLQHLIGRLGVPESRARLLASQIWEGGQ
jgi:hypothetical protein